MQRRKFPQPVLPKPKLIIQRQNLAPCINPSPKLTKTVSIYKISTTSKQNEKTEHIPQKRFSLQSIHKGNHERTTQGKLNRTVVIKDRDIGKSKKIMSIVDLEEEHFDYKGKIEGLANKIIKIIKSVKGSQSSEGMNRMEQAKLKEVLAVILEKAPNSKQFLKNISVQINALAKGQQQHHMKDIRYINSQKRTPILKIQQCVNQFFSCNFENKSQVHDSVSTKEEESRFVNPHTLAIHSSVFDCKVYDEMLKEKEEFVFQHLQQINDYILSQPNKILHEAFRRHKYLQEQLFAYADFLSISRLGANTYTPLVNIKHMESELDKSMRTLNKQLIQGTTSLEEKTRMLRDYVLQVRQSYSSILQELMKVVDHKTEQAKTFVYKVIKWEENYLTRKEYLGNLKKQYCQSLFEIVNGLTRLKEQGLDKQSKRIIISIEESISKIDRIYLLGNSFY